MCAANAATSAANTAVNAASTAATAVNGAATAVSNVAGAIGNATDAQVFTGALTPEMQKIRNDAVLKEIATDPSIFKTSVNGIDMYGRLTNGVFVPLPIQPEKPSPSPVAATPSASPLTAEEIIKQAKLKEEKDKAEKADLEQKKRWASLEEKLVKALVKKLGIKEDEKEKVTDPAMMDCEFDDYDCLKKKGEAIAKHLLRRQCREDPDTEECDRLREEDDKKAHNGVPVLDKALLDAVPALKDIPGLRFGAPPVNHTALRLAKEEQERKLLAEKDKKLEELKKLEEQHLKEREKYWEIKFNQTRAEAPNVTEALANQTHEIEARIAAAISAQRLADAQREMMREQLFNKTRAQDRLDAIQAAHEEALKAAQEIAERRTSAVSKTLVDWSYRADDPGRPSRWGAIRDTWTDCDGKRQSPVDIYNSLKVSDLPPIKFHYHPVSTLLSFDGRIARAEFTYGSTFEYRGTEYNLKKMIFHTPSEHMLNGVRFPMELQLFHQSAGSPGSEGKTVAVSILFVEGEKLDALEELMVNFPEAKGEVNKVEHFNPVGLLESAEHWQYYEYSGSITHPPCTENVEWVVMKHLKEALMSQINHVTSVIGRNFRPVQNVHERIIRKSE
jgi:carbonic anhydrase